MEINVEATAKAIENAAAILNNSAKSLKFIANQMREKNDLTFSAEAISEIINAVQNCKIDLLVTRPIRALSNSIERIKVD